MFELSKILLVTLSFFIVLLALASARYTGREEENKRVGSIFQPEPDPTIFRPTIEGAKLSGVPSMEINYGMDYME